MKRLLLTDLAKADLAGLDRAVRLRVAAAIQRLLQTNTGNIKRLQGIDPPEFRLRVGDWRVRFSYTDSETVYINRVRHRRDVFR